MVDCSLGLSLSCHALEFTKVKGEAESIINLTAFQNQKVAKPETLEECDTPAVDLTVVLLQNLGIVCWTVSIQLLLNTTIALLQQV